uniref:Guanylate cyclase n=2 Tax=Rhabditophanes sp. KR3021 TaxID=114890 RepID=A0AC35UA92_9BILA
MLSICNNEEEHIRYYTDKFDISFYISLIIPFLTVITLYNGQAKSTLNLGFIFPKTTDAMFKLASFDLSAGAIPMVIDQIREENLLNGYNFTFKATRNGCFEPNATGFTHDFIANGHTDVIFGPPCNDAAVASSYLSRFYAKPTFLWGVVSSSKFSDTTQFSNLVSVASIFPSLAITVIDVMKAFNWTRFTFIYASNQYDRCTRMYSDIIDETAKNDYKLVLASSMKASNPPLQKEFDVFLDTTQSNARIIFGCFDDDTWKRSFMLRMFDRKLTTDEYVFISLELKNMQWTTNNYNKEGRRVPFYLDPSTPPDGRDDDAIQVAKKTLVLDLSRSFIAKGDFDMEVLQRVKQQPFYCADCQTSSVNSSSLYSRYLYDAVLLWANILNKTLPQYGDKVFDDPSIYRRHCPGMYEGVSGTINMDKDCIRAPYFQLLTLSDSLTSVVVFNYTFSTHTTFVRSDQFSEISDVFKNWAYTPPLNIPSCGYSGLTCPINLLKDHLVEVIIVSAVVVVILIIVAIISIYAIYTTRQQNKAEMMRWLIPYTSIETVGTSKIDISQSLHSFNSSETSKNDFSTKNKTTNFIFAYLDSETIAAQRHDVYISVTPSDIKELNELIKMDHENVNKFYGMCLDSNKALSIYKYCKRGSLSEVLLADNTMFDSFFLMSLICDLTAGLHYIHSSSLIQYHGRLNSKNCLLNDRWQLKISNFNLKEHRRFEKTKAKNKLWIAPEHLRDESGYGSKEGDIYSLGIIFSEIVTKKVAWDLENRGESLEELVYLIKRGSSNPVRPHIHISHDVEINPAMIALIKDCWKEELKERPNTKQIRILIKAFTEKGAKNLMDHVFFILEQYAGTLKNEVEERTKELGQEQKRSDELLCRMLPPQIAIKLKMGKVVEPENFECVTILFSDIVKFSNIQNKSTPLQLINFVNNLFTLFDNLIQTCDIYKVETIADGYLCVSGLPVRNLERHPLECAKLALKFMECVHKYRIPHLPNDTVQLRIGLHSGPCVGTVIGLSMPRYCLFGDTVNTASRIESNGKEGKIHISQECYELLTKLGDAHMELRGEILIKGKGLLTTYFLTGLTGHYFLDEQNHHTSNI